MSRILTAAAICGEALGAIGAFPVTETAPDPTHLRRAMTWLDLILAQVTGTERLFSRVASTVSFTITNGTSSYDLYNALGSELPADKFQFIVEAFLEDSNGNRVPLEIVTRDKFEDVPKPAETGPPCWIWIDNDDATAPTLHIFPTPASTDTTVWSVKLVGQRYSPNVSPGGVLGSLPSASVLHDMGQAWQRWMICQLAHDLGSGPIHKLPEQSLNRFMGMATLAMTRLLAFENREHETTAPLTEPWGL